MKFLETSKIYSLNKSTYINLRWIAYIGQLIAILIVQFYLKFEFNYIACVSIVFLSILTNLYLIFKIKHHQLNNFTATSYLSYDIGQLGLLLLFNWRYYKSICFFNDNSFCIFCSVFKCLEFCNISYIYKFNFSYINLFLFSTTPSRNNAFSCSTILFI